MIGVGSAPLLAVVPRPFVREAFVADFLTSGDGDGLVDAVAHVCVAGKRCSGQNWLLHCYLMRKLSR